MTNLGVMAFTAGDTDLIGDVSILDNGQVVTSGGATTRFSSDVIHNGASIRTAGTSRTVFLAGFSGDGEFTGTGIVEFAGGFQPGNSPAVLEFEGSVLLGSNATTLVELAGTELGEFDRLEIAGNLGLDGELTLALIDGFVPEDGDLFLIANVDGLLTGQFADLGEGDLVATLDGFDFSISYLAGDGNDVGLRAAFSAVPEPGVFGFLVSAGVVLMFTRRRNRMSSRG